VPGEVRAFAPGRVNLIGEHTDYNRGLALPFAIAEGVTVRARADGRGRIHAHALDLGEHDEFALPDGELALPARELTLPDDKHAPHSGELAPPSEKLAPPGEKLVGRAPPRSGDWRAFVRGIATELHSAGFAIPGAELEIAGDLPRNAGLSSSAALEVALALALLALADGELGRIELARLCSRVENEWVGARTGLLDQLASLCGARDTALRIDFSDLTLEPVPCMLEQGWQLVTLDSGEPRSLAASGYNERRAECVRACALLGLDSLRSADERSPERLPAALARRVRHVLGENARVLATVSALCERDLPRVGTLLDASHASLRDLYECSTPAVEAAVKRLKQAGAAGARMIGGGFGGHVLGLFPPGATQPAQARTVRPSPGARLLD
jgi:galactokinase